MIRVEDMLKMTDKPGKDWNNIRCKNFRSSIFNEFWSVYSIVFLEIQFEVDFHHIAFLIQKQTIDLKRYPDICILLKVRNTIHVSKNYGILR